MMWSPIKIWDSSSSTDGKEGSAAGQVIAVRVISLAAALFWGVLFFGITDLLVVPDQDERFYEHYLLETGWGLLYTMLVMAPLVFWVVRPSWQVFPQQVTAVALAVLLCGLVTPAAGQAFVAFLLAITVIVPSVLATPAVADSRAIGSWSQPVAEHSRPHGRSSGSGLRLADDRGCARRQAG